MRGSGIAGTVLGLAVLCGAAGYAYWQRSSNPGEAAPARPASAASAASRSASASASQSVFPAKPRFRCDGRTECEQMTSCEEAMFFLQYCPKVNLDKDRDGIACEVLWCQMLKGK
jgi:hypothetical protein